ncbi:MAG TPA: glutaredoxin domain-containing protein [Phycisphaerae bacterium]|nr:glutaredoxin domain-containing protein [Phycisphaerae bacterium]
MTWVDWGDGVEVLTRAMCSGCQELKRRLTEAGIAFRELDVATVDGRAATAWYGDPGLLPAVAIDGRLIESGGDVDALFEAVLKRRLS